MNEFTSSFVAIPLPEVLKPSYLQVLEDVKIEFPEVQLTSGDNPHITVLYLKKSSIGQPAVKREVKERLTMIRGERVGVGEFGYFRGDNPRVLFLNVDYPYALEEYRDQVSAALSGHTARENDLMFHPHLSVGSIVNWPDFDIDVVNARIRKRQWTFPISRLGIYGADSRQKPEYQKLLKFIG